MRIGGQWAVLCALGVGLSMLAGCGGTVGADKKGGAADNKSGGDEVMSGIKAPDLTREFAKNEKDAEKKYSGKLLEVEGVVQRGTKATSGTEYTVFLTGAQEEGDSVPRSVNCYFELKSPEMPRAEALKKDQKVKIRGKFGMSLGSFGVTLKDCRIVE